MTEPSKTLEVGDRGIEISHPGKLLFPEDGITKLALARYYDRIAKTALPHFIDRALSMHRFPDGIDEHGFFQKQIGKHFPKWIQRISLPKQDGDVTYVVVDQAATLVYLADQASITPHLMLSRIDRPHYPDRMVFDLDPSDGDFGKVQRAARCVKTLLDRIELASFVQTTGSRGLHIVVPLDRKQRFDSVREFAHRCCRQLAAEHPDLLTVEQRKNQRGNRVFLDDVRNAYGQTSVAPYAVRALPGAPVATPLRWQEVSSSSLDPQRYHIGNLFRRLGQIQDPWHNLARQSQKLPAGALA